MLACVPALLVLSFAPLSPAAAQPVPSVLRPASGDFEKLSPFTAVRVNGESYDVQFESSWYRLVELNGISAAEFYAHCKRVYGRRAEKRFTEDLVEVLDGLGHKNATAVSLVLDNIETGERVEREKVVMTEANRRLVWLSRQGEPAPPIVVKRVTRSHSSNVRPEHARLADPLSWQGWSSGKILTREQAMNDLDQLEWHIENEYSYREMLGVDYKGALDAIRAGLTVDLPLGAFAMRLGQALSLFGDGHTRVRGLGGLRPTGYLPVIFEDSPHGVLAIRPDRSGYLDDAFPIVDAIDGRSIEDWLELAAPSVSAGSPHFVRRQCLQLLAYFNSLRVEAGDELSSETQFLLRNESGEQSSHSVELTFSNPGFVAWPPVTPVTPNRILDGNIGYLRVPEMSSDPEFLTELAQAMESFRETAGLIIDVRENGGGSRDALRTLLPYILDPADGPRVVNIGAYRLRPGDPRNASDGYLSNRAMYPESSAHWSDAELKAIQSAKRRFRPDWKPDTNSFSDWHYLAISAGSQYHYEASVVVLLNGGCFSATDIFLGAFSGVPGVTLMGTSSGGGSGRSQSSTLQKSGLRFRLSSMASFRPKGRRYDGVGVEPDIVVEPIASDHLQDGTDSVLEAALERLRKP